MKIPIFSNILIILIIITIIKTQLICDSSICQCSGSTCLSCLNSGFFYQNNTSLCKMCDYKCLKCNQPTACLSCNQGYFLSQNLIDNKTKCLECPKFCSSCIKNINTSLITCNSCIQGYALQSNQCLPCLVQNTLICQTQSTVLQCQSGYWKNGDSCANCRQFCLQCTSSSNCLQCQQGFRVQISAGTYCSPCPNGCKACTKISCNQCLFGYQLINGQCVSIKTQCDLISQCFSCSYQNNQVTCKNCKYPYYLKNGVCIKGSSLLCQNGAIGTQPYHCSLISTTPCPDNTYQVKSGGIVSCLPLLWIPNSNSDVSQLYYHASTGFDSFKPNTHQLFCSSKFQGIYSSTFNSYGVNVITYEILMKPYYKLDILGRYLPLYKSIKSDANISLKLKIVDNSSQIFQQQISTVDDQSCGLNYFSVSSKFIQDQKITLTLQSQILSNSNTSLTNFSSVYPKGLIALNQLLIKVYQCSQTCRICSNSRYCNECYGDYFVYDHQCVNQCFGLFEFYEPDGNISNYRSKSCQKVCSQGFFSKPHPTKNNTFFCSKCIGNCLTCKSQTQCLSCVTPLLLYDLNFTCISACPITHYNSSNKCKFCNSPCKTCSSEIKCLSCSIGFFNGSDCVGSCPAGTYQNIQKMICSPCQGNCSTCLNSPTFCLSCFSTFKLLGSNCLSQCPQKTHYPNLNICQTCKPPCIQCLSQTQCLNCLSGGFLYQKACLSTCPDGFYPNSTSNTCEACKGKCKTCISDVLCSSCNGTMFLNNYLCLTQCPARTYPGNNSQCLACLQPCLTCISSSKCLTCQIGYISPLSQSQFTCLNDCPIRYFANDSFSKCQKCSQQCSQCRSLTSCTSCTISSGLVLLLDKCVNQCSMGYYLDSSNITNKICRLCSYPCQRCINSPTNCLTCVSPYILDGNLCKSQCLTTQYQNQGLCKACVYPCQTCASQIKCLSCALKDKSVNLSSKQTYLKGSTCIEICPIGTYPDNTTLHCRQCSFPCQTCLDSKTCLTCSTGFLNKDQNTCQLCPSTYYPNSTLAGNPICSLCSQAISNCHVCDSQSICNFCQSGYYLFQHAHCITQFQCTNKKPGYFSNSQEMICAKCVLPCGNCTSQTSCNSCITGYLLGDQCQFQCPDMFYAQSFNNKCNPCNDSICMTCVNNPNTCLSCYNSSTSNLTVLLVSEKTCIQLSDCGGTFYIDNSFGYNRCLKCEPPCLACTSASQCTSCITGFLYTDPVSKNKTCLNSCPLKYYSHLDQQGLIQICSPCSSQCQQCQINSTNCISCNLPNQTTKYLQDNLCVTQCSANYFLHDDGLTCRKCQSPCKRCTSVISCLECLDNSLILYNGQCVVMCPDGTYKYNASLSSSSETNNNLSFITQQIQCLKCPTYCQLCQFNQNYNKPICKKCSIGLFMNLTQFGRCDVSCNMYQYGDFNTLSCYKCQSPCQKCVSSTQCLSCIPGYLYYQSNNECIKGDICPLGTFKHFIQSGNGSSMLLTNICQDICPGQYFGDSFSRTCQLSCKYNFIKFLTDKKCIQQCPQNYFIDPNISCHECTNNQTCIQSSSILSHTTPQNNSKLLMMNIDVKSIFNELFVKISFSDDILIDLINQNNMKVQTMPLTLLEGSQQQQQNIRSEGRFLQTTPVSLIHNQYPLQISYSVYQTNHKNIMWLSLQTHSSLSEMEIKVALKNYLLFPTHTLQNINSTFSLTRFDKYQQEQKQKGLTYEKISQVLSYIMCGILLLNILINSASISYPLIDFFQILFMLSFVQIDYPPVLNRYLYGYRFSHFLFLPQIFRTSQNLINTQATPGKFGVIVDDVNFLKNTGHAFILVFAAIAILLFFKLIDVLIVCKLKANKVSNDPNNQPQNHNRNQTQQQQSQQINKMSLSQQIINNHHGIIIKTIKNIVNRIKWNYINDIIYCLYFYLCFFAFAQTYDFSAKQGSQFQYASNFFSIVFIILTVSYPFFIYILLRINSDKIEQYQSLSKQKQTISKESQSLKCFYYMMKKSSINLILIWSPLMYFKKLILAIMLVYSAGYPSFVLALAIALFLIQIVLLSYYRPFKLFFHTIISGAFSGIFIIGLLVIVILQFDHFEFIQQQKIRISEAACIITIILAICIIIYNIFLISCQLLSSFCQKNCLKKYQEVQSDLQLQTKNEEQQRQKSNQQSQENSQSNIKLHSMTKEIKLSRKSQSQSSELDIYLKKDQNAPALLIQYLKKVDNNNTNKDTQNNKQNQKQDQSDQSEQSGGSKANQNQNFDEKEQQQNKKNQINSQNELQQKAKAQREFQRLKHQTLNRKDFRLKNKLQKSKQHENENQYQDNYQFELMNKINIKNKIYQEEQDDMNQNMSYKDFKIISPKDINEDNIFNIKLKRNQTQKQKQDKQQYQQQSQNQYQSAKAIDQILKHQALQINQLQYQQQNNNQSKQDEKDQEQ